jgi:hypothetical protein
MLRDGFFEAGVECQRRLELANLERLRLSCGQSKPSNGARLGVWLGGMLIAAGEALYARSQRESLRPRDSVLDMFGRVG